MTALDTLRKLESEVLTATDTESMSCAVSEFFALWCQEIEAQDTGEGWESPETVAELNAMAERVEAHTDSVV